MSTSTRPIPICVTVAPCDVDQLRWSGDLHDGDLVVVLDNETFCGAFLYPDRKLKTDTSNTWCQCNADCAPMRSCTPELVHAQRAWNIAEPEKHRQYTNIYIPFDFAQAYTSPTTNLSRLVNWAVQIRGRTIRIWLGMALNSLICKATCAGLVPDGIVAAYRDLVTAMARFVYHERDDGTLVTATFPRINTEVPLAQTLETSFKAAQEEQAEIRIAVPHLPCNLRVVQPTGWTVDFSETTGHMIALTGPHSSQLATEGVLTALLGDLNYTLTTLPPDRRIVTSRKGVPTECWMPYAEMRWPYAREQLSKTVFAMHAIGLPMYPLMWILDWLSFGRFPEYKKMRTIDGVYKSIEKVLAQRRPEPLK